MINQEFLLNMLQFSFPPPPKKKTNKLKLVLTEICLVLLALIFTDLVWCWWHIIKQIFKAFFCLLSKLFTLSNIIFSSSWRSWLYLEWIISDIKQNGMEYLLINYWVVSKIYTQSLFFILVDIIASLFLMVLIVIIKY